MKSITNLSPSSSKKEKEYIRILEKYPEQVYLAGENAPLEGFEYFASVEYRKKVGKKGNLITDKFASISIEKSQRLFSIFAKNVAGIFRGRNRSFADISDYLENLEKTGNVGDKSGALMGSYPNAQVWKSLTDYAWNKWRVLLGFTEVPRGLIFRNKAILFKYALVAIQEMDKGKIDTAPELDAGAEVLAVYTSLGLAVNDIARWLRKEFQLRCQANHPLGGLVSSVPLASKAGLGWYGKNGLLITPEYGQRQRIAPIFVEAPIFEFTDSQDHRWIEDYCALCQRCQSSCPTGAINEEMNPDVTSVPDYSIGKTRIEREKCYPYFNRTLGCSICVKVCPFSKGNGIYDKLKKVVEDRKISSVV